MLTIGRVKNDRGVKLGSLKVGDTFLYDNRVGVMVDRNGHCFPLDLTTCTNFRKSLPARTWMPHEYGAELTPETVVLPVEVEVTYKVVG